jgi:hypothetical protein
MPELNDVFEFTIELSELRRSPQFVRGRACFVEVTQQA